jgi:hypothetical protein
MTMTDFNLPDYSYRGLTSQNNPSNAFNLDLNYNRNQYGSSGQGNQFGNFTMDNGFNYGANTMGMDPNLYGSMNLGGSNTAAPQKWNSMGSIFGRINPETNSWENGWGGQAVGAASALGQTFLGFKSYQMAQKQFKQNKKEFAMNWEANKRITNANLSDRQNARVAANSNAQDTKSYMQQNGIA